MERIQQTYKIIESNILQKIAEFKSVRNQGDKRLFQELAFCLMTPQSKAENAWKTVNILTKNSKLFNGSSEDMAQDMSMVRFRNNKANYIVQARDKFFSTREIQAILDSDSSDFEKRKWFRDNVKGYGLKEASHFLRNIGFVENLTILDRHILRNLEKFNVINEVPKSISDKLYFEIENRMIQFSKEIKIPVAHLDMIFWYLANNTIFK